jgi:alpha-tubulin suppressor-like RCC1 family protein
MKFYVILIAMFLLVVCGFSKAEPLCGKIKSVSCGEYHALALMEDGSLWSCGDNSLMQLGVGKSTGYDALRLERVLGLNGGGFLKKVACFDAGWKHSLAADVNGVLLSWGTDTEGQLGNGNGNNNPSSYPIKVCDIDGVGYLSDARQIVAVSAGRSGTHSLVVDSNGYIYAFGNNQSGQCGDGTNAGPKQLPVRVVDNDPNTSNKYLGDITRIISVSAGEYHSIALDANGHIWEWGQNNGSYYPKIVKVSTVPLSNIIAISSLTYSMALDNNGNVWEWNSTSLGHPTPTKVAGGGMGTTYLQNIVAIAAGALSVAVDCNGNVWTWSGVGGSPIHVIAGEMQTASGYLENICQVDSGYGSFQIAVTNDGYGYSWGTNGDGRLGVGDIANRTKPAKMKCPEEKPGHMTKIFTIEGFDPNCITPYNEIENNYLTYTISYGNPVTNPADPNYIGTIHDVNITDLLPSEVDFDSATNGATYDPCSHSVSFSLASIAPGGEGSFQIVTKVNNNALPLSLIHNYCVFDSDRYWAVSEVNTPVCNWGGEIIYVDHDANGIYHNGTSWDEAYTTLQEGLADAQRLGDNIAAIWVAAGTYKPVESTSVSQYQQKSFTLFNNMSLMGHFGGIGTYETSSDQRNLADANNTTVLEGRIGTTQAQAVQYVVYGKNIASNCLIDGFTIKDSYSGAGIYLEDADVSVVNCRLERNHSYGIYAYSYSYADIHNCTFFNNTTAGCYSNSHSQPTISYSIFDGNNVNSTQGLYMSSNCAATVTDSIFRNNKSYGINGTNNGSLSVADSQFTNNSYGLNLSDITTGLTDSNITGSTYNGIYCTSSNVTLDHASIKNSTNSGISANNSDLSISHCLLQGNRDNGIYTSNGCNLAVANSVIRLSYGHGLELNDDTTTAINNSWINNNGTQHNSSNGGAGIYLANTTQTPLIRNVTIYDNWTYGIQANQYGPDPNVRNCIVYGNDSNDFFRTAGGSAFNKVNYCCLQHAHSSGTGNFTDNPLLNLSDANDLHLSADSPCINTGDPCGVYTNETDIDDEPRNDGRLDVGGDENYWSKADYNEDGIVNFIDYASFAAAWQTTNAQISLDDDNDVDSADLALFCRDWLWQQETSLAWMQGMRAVSQGNNNEMDTVAMMANTDSESVTTDVPTVASDTLMLTDVQTSKALRPKRLVRKTDGFYAITPESVAAWKVKTAALENSLLGSQANDAAKITDLPIVESATIETPVDINDLANWAQDLWNNDAELRATTTQEAWQEFIDSIKSGQ